jgi:hypothetical protein
MPGSRLLAIRPRASRVWPAPVLARASVSGDTAAGWSAGKGLRFLSQVVLLLFRFRAAEPPVGSSRHAYRAARFYGDLIMSPLNWTH